MTAAKPVTELAPVVEKVSVPAEEPEVVIPVRTESFSFELPQDRVSHDPNQYFVIIGSFRFSSNANAFKDKASHKGFSPFVLVSERGYYRIAVDSYTDERSARARVHTVRSNFPEYADAWLLIRK